MDGIQIFKSDAFGSVRTILQDGNILFCGKDVAEALGYQRAADAIAAHCKGVCVLPTPSNGGVQRMKFITEGDVYRLITHSRLPAAEQFESWVFDEVLPSIRKTGSYTVSEQTLKNLACLKKLQEQLNISKDLEAKFSELAAGALKNYREWREERDRLRTQAANIQHQIDTLICWMEIPQGHGERSLK